MKRLFTILISIFITFSVAAQAEKSIVIEQKSFRAVQTDALTGVNIDPIGLDYSKRPCARLKVKINRMTKAEIDGIEVKPITNNAVMKCKTAEYDNGLIIELTAKPQTRFYFHHDEFGDSNEVVLDLEADKEYYLEAYLNQSFSIVINTNVVGADVYLDNVFKGQTDNNMSCTISDVMIGNHSLKIVYGNLSREQSIDVNKNSILFRQTINIEESKPQFVVFVVEPQNAILTIDNRVQALHNGAVTLMLENGTYPYTVSAADYYEQSGTFVVSGAKVEKIITLSPAFGYLAVKGSNVDGAAVYVDDKFIGTAPITSNGLPSGKHSVRIIKEMYKPYQATVIIADNKTTVHNPALMADFATINITAPDNAEIWVNNTKKGNGFWRGPLSTGTYLFEARKEGYTPSAMTQHIGSTPSMQFYTLEAPKAITGSLVITSSPVMADVTLDGKAVGRTPLELTDIFKGEHTVVVSKDGHVPKNYKITVDENKTINLNATLVGVINQNQPAQKGGITSAPYKVGDYYNDGVKEGVVFEVSADGKHGKIVSMTQSSKELQWSSDKYGQEHLIGANSKTDGAYNMQIVKKIAGWQTKYPAFKWCADLGEGWYLPAIDELKAFTLNDSIRDAVNRTLVAKGGTRLYNRGEARFYWSSTEDNSNEFCAWRVDMYDGYTGSSIKNRNYYVRAVATFEDDYIKTIIESLGLSKSEQDESVDKLLIEHIRKRGGSISFTSSGTAISKDGYTNFRIRAISDSMISVAVSGRTGNGVSFTNAPLAIELKDGDTNVQSSVLKSARYIYFRFYYELSSPNTIDISIDYQTASYSKYRVSEIIYL